MVWLITSLWKSFCCVGVGQLALEQQVAGVEEVALLGQLLDRVAAVQQLALVAVDVGDRRVARRGGQEARVVGELAGLAYSLRMSITSGPTVPCRRQTDGLPSGE